MPKDLALKIRISTQGRNASFELAKDCPFVIGRSPEAHFQIPSDSISVQHLELLWDGIALRIRDMESSNGTHRLPQDSPFLEAHFSPKDREIQLRLAKIPLTLSWEGGSGSDNFHEKTELISTASSLGSENAPKTLPPQAQQAKTKSATSELPRTLHLSGANKFSSWAWALFLSSIFVAVAQNFFFFFKNAAFFQIDSSLWSLGPAIDLYIFWVSDLPVFLLLWVAGGVIAFFVSQKLPPVLFLSTFKTLVLFGLASLFSLLILVWPFAFLLASAQPAALHTAVGEYRQLEKLLSSHDFSAKERNITISSKLSDLSDPLKGSSVFYAFWHNFQKKRVVGECGGIGDGEWEKKRLCLVLLYALSLDAYTSIRPVYLGPTASSLVFLSSLDGVIRVLAAEGPNSDNLNLFISTLDGAGLKQEALDFVALVESFRGQNFDNLMKALLELRLSVERRISQQQRVSEIPPEFNLNLMGPLEMGI
jgi:hypothetical protein